MVVVGPTLEIRRQLPLLGMAGAIPSWHNLHGGGQGRHRDRVEGGLDVGVDRGGGRRLRHGLRGGFEGQIRRAKGRANLWDLAEGSNTGPFALAGARAEGAGNKAAEAKRGKLHI